MIRIIVFPLFLLLSFGLSAQADRQVSEVGKLGYQYSRTFERNPQNANELIVTFVFVNGCRQHAITLRQEFEKDCFRWISTPDGTRGGESFVAFSTANLAPNQSVIWKYAVRTNHAHPDRAALMILGEDYGVEKIFLEQ